MTLGLMRRTPDKARAAATLVMALLGTGALATALPAGAANLDVSNDAQLRNAISSAASGDTITFKADITLVSVIWPNLLVFEHLIWFNQL